ncbi:MAG: CcmD family protein [Chitinophagaceae bacterium]
MKILTTILLLLLTQITNAQTVSAQTSLDIMKSNGKIYVVVAVVLVILLGLFAYVWRLDKKITKLENNLK